MEDVLGDDILGGEQTAEVNDVLTDLGEALDDADSGLDDAAEDARAALDDADEGLDDAAEEVTSDAGAAPPATGTTQPGTTQPATSQPGTTPSAGATEAEAEAASGVSQAVDAVQAAPGQAVAQVVGDQTVFAWVTPANNSGAQAVARMSLDGASLAVAVEGSGFAPG